MQTGRQTILTFKTGIRISLSLQLGHNQPLRRLPRHISRLTNRLINSLLINTIHKPVRRSRINIKTRVSLLTTMTSRTSHHSHNEQLTRPRHQYLVTSHPYRNHVSSNIMRINRTNRTHHLIRRTTRPNRASTLSLITPRNSRQYHRVISTINITTREKPTLRIRTLTQTYSRHIVITGPNSQLRKLIRHITRRAKIQRSITRPLHNQVKITRRTRMLTIHTRALLGLTPIRRPRIKILPLPRPLRGDQRRCTISLKNSKRTYNRRNRVPRNNLQVNRSSKYRPFMNRLQNRQRVLTIRHHSQRRQTMMSIRIRPTRLTPHLIMFHSRLLNIRTGHTNRPTRLKILTRLFSISITLLLGSTSTTITRIKRRIHTFRHPRLLAVLRRPFRTMVPNRFHNLLTQRMTTLKRPTRQFRHNTNTRHLVNTTVRRLRRLRNRFRVTRTTTTGFSLTILRHKHSRILSTLTRLLAIMSRILTLQHTPRREPNRTRMYITSLQIPHSQTHLGRHLRLPILHPFLMMYLV